MRYAYLLLVLVACYGCQSNRPELAEDFIMIAVAEDSSELAIPVANIERISEAQVPGYYVGDFRNVSEGGARDNIAKNRITIIIESFQNGAVAGKSVVAGNVRPFSGTYEVLEEGYRVRAEEPGDDPYDGTFTFTVEEGGYPLQGDWRADNRDLKGSFKEYRLQKQVFSYDPTLELPDRFAGLYLRDPNLNAEEDDIHGGEFTTEDVLSVNPSVQRLTSADVENMYKADLEILRNSIYARHGYSFKNKRIRYVFDHNVGWYIPVSTDVRTELTEVELANIELIKRYEEHADRYYDSFGR